MMQKYVKCRHETIRADKKGDHAGAALREADFAISALI